jgi:UDP-N-acetylmuramate dehydrogenase
VIADEGIEGIVVLIRLRGFRFDGDFLIADAGTSMSELVAASIARGYGGLTWASGLPGTIGGAIVGNAGTFGKAIGDRIVSVEVMEPQGSVRTLSVSECRFGYRTSMFKTERRDFIVLRATLQLERGEPEVLRRETLDAIAFREKNQPRGFSVGSYFTNPPRRGDGDSLLQENLRMWGDRIPAGWLIERAGMKGEKIGGAMVSPLHANFIVNTGGATAGDILALAARVKERVAALFGISLTEEVRLLGFHDEGEEKKR